MSIKNARILGVRLDEKTTARVAAFEDKTHIEGVSLARAALLASLDYFEDTGSLSLPLRVVALDEKKSDTNLTRQKMASLSKKEVDDKHEPSTSSCPTIPVDSAASTNTSPKSKPPLTTASIAPLPPPPVVATAGHWSLNETPQNPPVPEPRREVRYEKKPRRKA